MENRYLSDIRRTLPDADGRRGAISGGRRRVLTAAGLAAAVLLLSACGEPDYDSGVMRGQNEWDYVPEFIVIEEEGLYSGEAQLAGGSLYYPSWDAEGRARICAFSIDSKEMTATVLDWQGAGALQEGEEVRQGEGALQGDGEVRQSGETSARTWKVERFDVKEEGGFYVLARIGAGTPQDSYELCQFDASGGQVFSVDVTELLDGHYTVMTTDAKGRLYLGCGEKVWLYDETGGCQGSISLGNSGEWAARMGCGRDGKVYAAYYKGTGVAVGQADYYLAELDFDKKSVGTVYGGFRGDGNAAGLIPGTDGDFLVSDEKTVYGYSPQTQTEQPLFDWLDCSVDGAWAQLAGVLEDGRIVAVYEDSWDETGGIAILSKAEGQAAQKEDIVFGAMTLSGTWLSEVVKFNREDSRYRIVVKEYYTDGKSWEDAAEELARDIGVGNCPDVVSLTGLKVSRLAEKGVFADLSPYLEESGVLDREDFLENVLDAYTFGDVLVSIPSHILIRTVAGSVGLLENQQGWTVEDVIAYADTCPEAELFDRASKDSIMRFLMMCNVDTFLDWQTGECSFDSDQFKHLLEFVNRFPGETMPTADTLPAPARIQEGQVLLMEDFLYGFESAQLHREMFRGEMSPREMSLRDMAYVGYPTMDKSGGHVIFSAEHAYAIPERAACKDGAWSFLENVLTQAYQGREWGMSFPTRKSRLEAKAREAMQEKEEYDSISYAGGYGVNALHWSYTYHAATQEEVDQVLAVVKQARLPAETDEEILNIISEETEGYYQGQKTVDETAAVIQSRVGIYVKENQ